MTTPPPSKLTETDYRVDKPLTPRKAMRAKCLECSAGSANEVKLCPMVDCALWPYRIGRGICRDPEGKVVDTGERGNRRGNAEALQKARESKTPA